MSVAAVEAHQAVDFPRELDLEQQSSGPASGLIDLDLTLPDPTARHIESKSATNQQSRTTPAMVSFLNGFSLFGISQMLFLESKSCFLEATSAGLRGSLVFSNGELVDAEINDLRGDLAAEAMLAWDNPTVWIHESAAPVRITITKPVTQLLLESLCKLDESEYKRSRGKREALSPLAARIAVTADADNRLTEMAQSRGVRAIGIVDVRTKAILAQSTPVEHFSIERALAELTGSDAVKTLDSEEIREVRVKGGDAQYVMRPFDHVAGVGLVVAFEPDYSGAARSIRRLVQLSSVLISTTEPTGA
jgi:hypothetical protein